MFIKDWNGFALISISKLGIFYVNLLIFVSGEMKWRFS